MYEMWKTRAPARTEVCSQKFKVQGMPQNWTLPEGMPIQEKRQKSQFSPGTNPDEHDTHNNENGVRQPNPPVVNMLKIVSDIGATKGPQGKHLKFSIDVDPRGLYKHHLVVRVDMGTA